MNQTSIWKSLLKGLAATSFVVAGVAGAATSAEEQLAALRGNAGSAPQAALGQEFFTTKHGHEWSCSSCHGALPTGQGKHAATGKLIGPLAPAFNPQRFTDQAKTEKWFRRNCNDVVGRECTAAEKANLIAWLLTLKP